LKFPKLQKKCPNGEISGLLSEQAVEKIRLTGIAVFRAPSPPHELGPEAMRRERWAVGLQEAMKTQGKTATDLVSYAGVPLQTVEDWIVERRPVPPQRNRSSPAG
jgi:hypothetical protein